MKETKNKKQLTLHFTIQGLRVNYPQTTINWQNMKISADSWNSLTLPFKVVVQLYEIRNARIGWTLVCMLWHGAVENSLNWEAEDRGFISESATY